MKRKISNWLKCECMQWKMEWKSVEMWSVFYDPSLSCRSWKLIFLHNIDTQQN
jgi:hypothetical protein